MLAFRRIFEATRARRVRWAWSAAIVFALSMASSAKAQTTEDSTSRSEDIAPRETDVQEAPPAAAPTNPSPDVTKEQTSDDAAETESEEFDPEPAVQTSDDAVETESEEFDPEPAVSKEAGESDANDPESTDTLSVSLLLFHTSLTEEKILAALKNEFRIPVVAATRGEGLVIRVDGPQLTVSFIDQEGGVVRRSVQLPSDEARKLDTIALLAGNLARDEAADLLAQLEAAQTAKEAAAEKSAAESADVPAPTPPPVAPSPPPEETQPVPVLDIRTVGFSASLTGDVSFPADLEVRRPHFVLGLAQSKMGALDGASLSLLASQNLGLGDPEKNRGAQISVVWVENRGPFRGVLFSLANHSSGRLSGAQIAGLATFQKSETRGAQVAGIFALGLSHLEGAQVAGLSANTFGNVSGAQVAGLTSFAAGDVSGAQLAGLVVASTGRVKGAQLAAIASYATTMQGAQVSLVPVAGTLEGTQVGITPIATRRMSGLQLGLINYAGSFRGTQLGLINLGGRGRGTQLGLLNVARRNEGKSVGLISIVPNLRTQLLTYGSYTPIKEDHEGVPKGPLLHAAIRFLPEPIYTQFNVGFGPEGEDCPTDEPGTCHGGEESYSVGFGTGLRLHLIGPLFLETELGYQFERAFNQREASRHGILLKGALAVELVPRITLFAGAGPRMDFRTGELVDPTPEVGFAPHYFGGFQFF